MWEEVDNDLGQFDFLVSKPAFECNWLIVVGTLKMASAKVVKTSVSNNSPSQDSNHPNDLFQSRSLLIVVMNDACTMDSVLCDNRKYKMLY